MPARTHAQAVYKCNSRTYSEQPCSKRIVGTDDAPVPAAPKAKVVVAHRLPGETSEEFTVRKHRARLSATDRDECARLDKRIPFERQRLKASTWEEDIDDAQTGLADSEKRFRQLRC
jgi:hypothetical protein